MKYTCDTDNYNILCKIIKTKYLDTQLLASVLGLRIIRFM